MVTAMQDLCLSCYMRFFREVASFFKKKSYLCTEMSDKREYWTSMRWRYLQSKGILSREGGRKDGRWVITNKNSMNMNKREYTQANKDWLTAKAQEEGVKSLPKGIYYTLKVGSLPCSKCVWAINGRSISLPRWVMASSHSQASPEVPHSFLRLSFLALRK